jgi:hypothetical protein
VHAHVAMSLLETAVLLDVVQVVTTNDDRTLHFHFAHDTGQDAATDGTVAGEWTLFVDVGAILGLKE